MRGKKPNLRQKRLIARARLNPNNWLVTKNPVGELYIQHRHTGSERVIKLRGNGNAAG
ncbi:DUF6906 family protein [Desulfofalx alkaliphila]|uniref:DUF6906 family protein n=1 Tax=Desulfofalx alkaliphila TaxID=105483 RepID=UPI000A4498E7